MNRHTAGAIDSGEYLQQRARRVLAAVENRNPRVAALQDREPWRPWLMLGLPLMTWVRFVVWLAAGLAVYFGFGRANVSARHT